MRSELGVRAPRAGSASAAMACQCRRPGTSGPDEQPGTRRPVAASLAVCDATATGILAHVHPAPRRSEWFSQASLTQTARLLHGLNRRLSDPR